MVDKYGTGLDPYCYPGTDVLVNKFNIQNKVVLEEAEREITTAALSGISFSLPPYDLTYLKNLHRLLFSRIYDWAGKIRSIDISKEGTRFFTSSRIEPEANRIFGSLGKDKYFGNSPARHFNRTNGEAIRGSEYGSSIQRGEWQNPENIIRAYRIELRLWY